MSKIAMTVAGGVGYLLGSRAGREPYEKVMARVQSLRNDPEVRQRVADTKDTVADKAGDVAQRAKAKVADGTSASETTTA